MTETMKSLISQLWHDEEGAEIAEWIVVVAMLVIVAAFIYNQILRRELSSAVNAIGSKIQSAANAT